MKRMNDRNFQARSFFLPLLLLFVAMSTSCQAPKRMEKETLTIGEFVTTEKVFSELLLETELDVTLVYTPQNPFVQVTGPKKVLDYIRVKNVAGKMSIEDKKDIPERISRISSIKIGIPQLKKIASNGTGDIKGTDIIKAPHMLLTALGTSDIRLSMAGEDIEIENGGTSDCIFKLEYPKVKINNNGTGDIRIEGTGKELIIGNFGTGDLHLQKFRMESIEAQNTGTGDVSCWAIQKLSVENSGTGDFFYYGSPKEKNISNSGTGNVKQRY